MKIKEIIGDDYFGNWANTRTACRAIIIREGEILLSYETKTDQWMLPGGSLEPGEKEKACVIRETSEETGFVIEPSECLLEIDEYYEDWRFINRYFTGTIIGTCEKELTDREKEVGMEPRWLPLEKIMAVFSRHNDYAESDEMRRGMYLREYTALKKRQERPSLKERLAQKKDIVAKNEANREPRQMNKDRGAQALA